MREIRVDYTSAEAKKRAGLDDYVDIDVEDEEIEYLSRYVQVGGDWFVILLVNDKFMFPSFTLLHGVTGPTSSHVPRMA